MTDTINPAQTALTRIGDERIVASGGEYLIEGRHGAKWQREMSCSTLDEAIERAARRYVERRFRSAHAEIPLDYSKDRGESATGTRLVYRGNAWRLESLIRGRPTVRGSWPTVYAALVSPRRNGARHKDLAGIRGAIAEAHVAATAELRDRLADPSDAPLVNTAVFVAPERGVATLGPTDAFSFTNPQKTSHSRAGFEATDTGLEAGGLGLPGPGLP